MKRGIRTLLVGAILLGGNLTAIAQDKTRPATAADFVGVFRLLAYPVQQQPKMLKQPLWTGDCQFFGHYPDGYWLHQMTEGRCANSIPGVKPALPRTVEWRLAREGFVIIDRKEQRIQEVWKVDRVNRASNLASINVSEGDLIMQLLDRDLKQVLWIRLLGRIGNASNR